MGTDNRDSSTQRPPPREPVAALDGALDALQGMLERQRVVPPDSDPEGADLAEDLPVLDQVVIPGAGARGAKWPRDSQVSYQRCSIAWGS